MRLKQITVRVTPATFNAIESKSFNSKEKPGVYLRRVIIDHLNNENRRQIDDVKFKRIEQLISEQSSKAYKHQEELDELILGITQSLNQIYGLLTRRAA